MDELPKIMKSDENHDAATLSHLCKKVDEIVRWINKQDDKFKAINKLMKLSGEFVDEEPKLDTVQHPLYEEKK